MANSNKIVGKDFLHPHFLKEKSLNLEPGHIIVDKEDWEKVVSYFKNHPEAVKELE